MTYTYPKLTTICTTINGFKTPYDVCIHKTIMRGTDDYTEKKLCNFQVATIHPYR